MVLIHRNVRCCVPPSRGTCLSFLHPRMAIVSSLMSIVFPAYAAIPLSSPLVRPPLLSFVASDHFNESTDIAKTVRDTSGGFRPGAHAPAYHQTGFPSPNYAKGTTALTTTTTSTGHGHGHSWAQPVLGLTQHLPDAHCTRGPAPFQPDASRFTHHYSYYL